MMNIFRIPKAQLAITLFLILMTAFIVHPSFEKVQFAFLVLTFTIGTDLLFIYIRKRTLFIPYAAIVSGLILSLTLSPNLPWYEILIVASISMGLKNFLRISAQHIFNPAAAGLVIGNIILQQNVTWWGVSFQTLNLLTPQNILFFSILLSPLLVSAYRMRRYGSILSFFITYAFFLVFLNHFNFTTARIIVFDPHTIFFSIVMLPEPMTSPVALKRQLLYGTFIALVATLISSSPVSAFLAQYHFLPDSLLPFLLLGNLLFFKFK